MTPPAPVLLAVVMMGACATWLLAHPPPMPELLGSAAVPEEPVPRPFDWWMAMHEKLVGEIEDADEGEVSAEDAGGVGFARSPPPPPGMRPPGHRHARLPCHLCRALAFCSTVTPSLSPGVAPTAAARVHDVPARQTCVACRPARRGGVARQGELLPAEQLVGRLPYLHGGSSRAPQPRRLQVLKRHFGKYKPEVLGIGGDMTAHLWWRLLHGETPAKHHPKAVVLLIGTNDLGMVWQGEYCY